MQLFSKDTPIWFATQPIDFRNSIDGLCSIVQQQFDLLPHEAIFIFHNRARNRIKILFWHQNGYLLIYKRFETGKLFYKVTEDEKISINPDQLNWLLLGLDWELVSGKKTCKYKAYS